MQDRKKTWDPGNSVLKIPATWDSKNSKKDGLEKYREALADMGLSTFQHENRPAEEVRSELYKSLPSSGIVAEIGVATGENAVIIDKLCTPKKLYLIDPWDLCKLSDNRWHTDEHKKRTHAFFADKPNATIIQDFSVEASKKFENHYFDWIFLDAYPDYRSVKTDLAHWLPKIKKGGYIVGDEFAFDKLPHWDGVYTAVIEFILKYAAKRPDLIDQMERQYDNARIETLKPLWGNPRECMSTLHHASLATGELKIENEQIPFASVSVSLSFKTDVQFKVSTNIVEAIKEYMDYYPSTRVRGGIYKIKIGDWVDDLNCEEIIKDLTINPPLPREQNILSQTVSTCGGVWNAATRNYGLYSGILKPK